MVYRRPMVAGIADFADRSLARLRVGVVVIVAVLSAMDGIACRDEALAADSDEDVNRLAEFVAPFLKTHCLDCHGEHDPAGDVRLDQFIVGAAAERDTKVAERAAAEKAVADKAIWQRVRRMLVRREMPPADQEQPPSEEGGIL